MKIDKVRAERLIRDAATSDPSESAWIEKVETLSRLCQEGVSSTHIAFLGTAILAKAVDARADLFAIKPTHAQDNPNAFSARSLCHSVWVPLAAELGINLGVTGREPLNNQPYFRMTRLDDGTPVHPGGRAAFDYMVEIVRELDQAEDTQTAWDALRAFVAVRRRYQPRQTDLEGDSAITPDKLMSAIPRFVLERSENGKRAQAVVAGLMDVFAGPERVESGRINDPSRRYPGDVCVRSATDHASWDKAIEVRDKPVEMSDVQIFAKKCVDMGVREAALVAVSERQQPLDALALTRWANGFGIGLTFFGGWKGFIDQALYWSDLPKPLASQRAAQTIYQRLLEVEASEAAVRHWVSAMETGSVC